MKKFFKGVMGFVFGIILVTVTIAVISSELNEPIVYNDSITGECIAVEDPHGLRGCSQMPSKYSVFLIAPDTTLADLKRRRAATK